MPDIGTLRAVVTADATRFNAGVRSAESRLAGLRTLVSGIFTGAAIAGVVRFSQALRTAADEAAQLVERSRQIGVGVEDLQRIQRVFQSDGIEIERTNRALTTFLRRIQEARQGLTTPLRALADIGLDVEDFTGNAVTDLQTVQQALQGIDDAAVRASAGFNLLGREGVAIAEILQRAGNDFERIVDQAGPVLSAEAALNLKEIAQSYVDITNATRVAFQEAIGQTPILTATLGQLADEIERIPAAIRRVRELASSGLDLLGIDRSDLLALSALLAGAPDPTLNRLGGILARVLADNTSAIQANTQATEAAAAATAEFQVPAGIAGLSSMVDPSFDPNRAAQARDFEQFLQDTLRPALENAFGPFIDEVVPVIGQANREFQLSTGQAFILGSTLNTVITDARGGFEDLGDTILRVLQQLIGFGLGNLAGGLGFFGGARQFGGPVSANVPYLVGERGPELFVPSTSGNVVADPGSAIRFNVQVGDARGIPQLRAFFRNEAIPMLDEYLRDRSS